ncbi:MAG: hypothetical protein ACH350_08140 [Parachlamydiaceae bacterium]
MQKNISFWFCTFLSGIIIGIASQRIPQAANLSESFKPNSYSYYCKDSTFSPNHSLLKPECSIAYEGSGSASWVYNRFTKEHIQRKERSF